MVPSPLENGKAALEHISHGLIRRWLTKLDALEYKPKSATNIGRATEDVLLQPLSDRNI